MKNISLHFFLVFLLITIVFHQHTYANETAAGISASGIYFKDEKRISIEKEVLYISPEKVEVSYLFKNHSSENIVTMVAFPVPEYHFDESAQEQASWRDFHDFTVEVNDKKVNHEVETKAMYMGKDYAPLLKRMGVPVNDYGQDRSRCNKGESRKCNFSYVFQHLKEKDKKTLVDLELVMPFEGNHEYPTWNVSTKYHWTQIFPANSITAIKHTYTPNTWTDTLDYKYLELSCADEEIKSWLQKSNYGRTLNVKYILLTANNWKQPIKEFHMIVEVNNRLRHAWGSDLDPWRISMCSDEKLTKVNSTRYEVVINDFIPRKDIDVYFIGRMGWNN
jgi:hypothetical protein